MPLRQGAHSLVDRLATETLALIFMMGASPQMVLPETLPESADFPVLISHVCRQWRTIALETSQLWTTIFVRESFALLRVKVIDSQSPDNDLYGMAYQLRIEAFLERSKARPLTIYLDMRSPSWDFHHNELEHPFTSEHVSLLMDILLPHLDRWENVEVLSDTWPPLAVIMERCSRAGSREQGPTAISLRRLALSRCNAFFALEGLHLIPGSTLFLAPFLCTPLLRDVTLSGVHIDWRRHFMHNLTGLSLNYHAQEVLPSAHELVILIRSSPSLERLSILGWGVCSFDDGADSTELENTIVVRNLSQLSFGWVNTRYSLRLLSLFSWNMPKLRSITLEDITNCLDPLSSQDSSGIIDFISGHPSGGKSASLALPEIEELTLRSVLLSMDSLSRFMAMLPTLQSLTLHNADKALLDVVHLMRGGTESMVILFPDLSHILVKTAGCIPQVELDAMVRSRETVHDHPSRRIAWEVEDLFSSFMEPEPLDQEEFDITFRESDIYVLQDDGDIGSSNDDLSNEDFEAVDTPTELHLGDTYKLHSKSAG